MSYIIDFGGVTDPEALRLDTRRRSHIPNVPRRQYPQEHMQALVEGIQLNHPEVRLLSASSVYNCYGLAFASRRTCIVDWTDVGRILEEDDFHPLPWDPNAWERGDIALYREGDDPEILHVALIAELRPNLEEAEFEVWAISAWGDRGEYMHRLEDVPLTCGTPSEVVSQRVFL